MGVSKRIYAYGAAQMLQFCRKCGTRGPSLEVLTLLTTCYSKDKFGTIDGALIGSALLCVYAAHGTDIVFESIFEMVMAHSENHIQKRAIGGYVRKNAANQTQEFWDILTQHGIEVTTQHKTRALTDIRTRDRRLHIKSEDEPLNDGWHPTVVKAWERRGSRRANERKRLARRKKEQASL